MTKPKNQPNGSILQLSHGVCDKKCDRNIFVTERVTTICSTKIPLKQGFNHYCHSVTTVTVVKEENRMSKANLIDIATIDYGRGKVSLTNVCIEAASTYLQHSSQKEQQTQGKSQDIVGIVSCIPKITEDGVEIFELEVGKPLKSNEFVIRDKHNKVEYIANEDFSVVLYDRTNSVVTIKFNKSEVMLNTGFNPNIELSFDLRILIINQRTVYQSHSMDIEQPKLLPGTETKSGYQYVQTFEHPSLPVPNTEQKEAITTMLSSHLSFIEGPPGVGKTVTLSIPILSYMAAGKPVAIITPTKVSLERSLSAVIDICKEVGLDTSKILRLGDSSLWFGEEYPETLESSGSAELINQEKLDLLLLEIALEYKGMASQIKLKEEELTIDMLISDLLDGLNDLYCETFKPGSIEHKNLHKMIEIKMNNLKMNTYSSKVIEIFKNMNYRNYQEVFNKFYLYQEELEAKESINPLSKQERDTLRINNIDYSSYGSRIELYEELVGSKYNNMSENDIKAKIIGTTKRISKFKKEFSDKKRADALLIGMTADSYNSRYKEESLDVHHIFIDEGGYLPLIKAYGICRADIPISILGDTMQLPPVFEMQKTIKQGTVFESLFLYDLNSFYLETLFNGGYEGLREAYFSKREPQILTLPKVNLKQTYRFGEKLANILDQYVYKNGFTSAIGDDGFQLEYIDAVNMSAPPGGRVNPAETDAIKDILYDIDGTVSVLTPYKNQVSHLQKSLKGLIDSNQIMSIHKSQGQEWDTVIISVVDHQSRGAYGKYFTSSLNQDSNGLKIVNTAVSRAKRKLILVGHYGFWTAQQDELFGELFRSAEQIGLNKHMEVA